VQPSTADRFTSLADIAQTARDRGDYAIAAAFVIRVDGREVTFFGKNSVFSHRDPIGHAEIDALRLAGRMAAGVTQRDDSVEVRKAPGEADETTLYATFEPCPMCTVAAINARPDRIVIAVEDPPSGSMHPDRLAALPPIWGELAQTIDIVFCQSERPQDTQTYLPPELLRRLTSLFVDNRGPLDELLAARGVIERDAVLSRVAVE
jgi:tRNA(Arg) A34 adenosine deaminase TadA